MIAKLKKLLPERALALDMGVLFSGFTLQLLTQIGWLVLALRVLGPGGYGLFASLTAVTIALSSLVGLGSDQLLIRHAAGDREALPRWIGHALLSATLTGLPLGLLLLALLPLFEIGSIGLAPLAAVLAADLLFGRYANLCTMIYIATGQAGRQSLATVLIGAMRLAAIALAWAAHAALGSGLSLAEWAFWYLGASALAALCCLALVVRDHGRPVFAWIQGSWREGLSFAAEGTLQASAADLDKPIVLELAGPHAAGLYAAAFRIIGTLYLPIRALGYALYGRLFRMAAGDRAGYGLRLLPVGLGLGLAAALGVLVFADLLPWIFGAAYAELPPLLRLICLTPAAYAAFYIGADVLSATARQGQRLAVVALSLGLTLLLCWIAVPIGGIEAAALARLAVMALTAALVWLLALRRPPSTPGTDPAA